MYKNTEKKIVCDDFNFRFKNARIRLNDAVYGHFYIKFSHPPRETL